MFSNVMCFSYHFTKKMTKIKYFKIFFWKLLFFVFNETISFFYKGGYKLKTPFNLELSCFRGLFRYLSRGAYIFSFFFHMGTKNPPETMDFTNTRGGGGIWAPIAPNWVHLFLVISNYNSLISTPTDIHYFHRE